MAFHVPRCFVYLLSIKQILCKLKYARSQARIKHDLVNYSNQTEARDKNISVLKSTCQTPSIQILFVLGEGAFFLSPPQMVSFAPPLLALKMLLFYIKSTTCLLCIAHCSPNSRTIYNKVFLCIVLYYFLKS